MSVLYIVVPLAILVVAIAVGALLLFIVCLLLFVFQVRKSEVVVVTTFGKPTRSISEPGRPIAPGNADVKRRATRATFRRRLRNLHDVQSKSRPIARPKKIAGEHFR